MEEYERIRRFAMGRGDSVGEIVTRFAKPARKTRFGDRDHAVHVAPVGGVEREQRLRVASAIRFLRGMSPEKKEWVAASGGCRRRCL